MRSHLEVGRAENRDEEVEQDHGHYDQIGHKHEGTNIADPVGRCVIRTLICRWGGVGGARVRIRVRGLDGGTRSSLG